jgi:hypothetical protein
MTRELTTYPFPPTLKNKLLKGGFRYVSDLKDIKIVELSKGKLNNNCNIVGILTQHRIGDTNRRGSSSIKDCETRRWR